MSSTSSVQSSETIPLLRKDISAADNETVDWRETWRLARPYVIPATWRLRVLAVFSLICELLNRAVALLPPFAYKLAVDSLSANAFSGVLVLPFGPLLLYFAANLTSTLLDSVADVSYTLVESHSSRRFAIDIYEHLLSLSLSFHLRKKTGEIAKIMDRGIESIDTIAHAVLFTIMPTIVEAVLVTVIFVQLGKPFIALATLLTVVAYFAFTIVLTRWRNKFRHKMIDIENASNGKYFVLALIANMFAYDYCIGAVIFLRICRGIDKAIDTLINYETVKMFATEKEEVSSFVELEDVFRDTFIWYNISLNFLSFGQQAIKGIGLGIAMVLAARATASKALTPGDFVLIVTYVSQLFQPLISLGSSYRVITQAVTDLEKCVAILKTEVSVKDAPQAIPLHMGGNNDLPQGLGEIRFENVSFNYEAGEGEAGLKGISFAVNPGQTVAIVGASGTGKSTIMRLLLRLYDVESGAILVNGTDVKNLTQYSLRKQIGVVAQDTLLFNHTLRYNISYGNQNASDAEVMAAVQLASLGPFVESLPLGLDTVVGELGVRLSGGEKQRVGIARCLLKSPSIILLDEASSFLDTLTEREMQANLREVCKGRTTLVVAHRLSTIMHADEIIVLGKCGNSDDLCTTVVERGKHQELLDADGIYAEMWHIQSAAVKMCPSRNSVHSQMLA